MFSNYVVNCGTNFLNTLYNDFSLNMQRYMYKTFSTQRSPVAARLIVSVLGFDISYSVNYDLFVHPC